MKTINDFLSFVDILDKEIFEQINTGNIGLRKQNKIIAFKNQIGHLLLKDVVEKIKELV